jgi:ABC-type antimicrobial peptide transport system permease subunit
VRQRLRKLNAEIVVSQERKVLWWLDTQGWGRERFIATLFGLFAALALVLAATGLYSVVSFAVTQRTQELGIRMALGAPRNSVIRLVLSRLITSWAGGSPRDPVTLLGAALGLAVVATLACILPAWRAASIDPMRALRTE